MTRLVPVRVAALLAALALAVTGCGGDDKPKAGDDPQQVMQSAKAHFDEASSVHFVLETADKPDGGDAVLGAEGTLTRQPAFEGKVKVLFSGFDANIPITSVDGVVYAKLPLTPGYTDIDPAEYGAPDPAEFIDPDKGFSGLLLEIEGLEEGDSVRDGKQILTSYTGTVSGERVQAIIPSADPAGDFAVQLGIDDDGRLSTLQVTGDFFGDVGEVTYNLAFDSYDEDVTVTKP